LILIATISSEYLSNITTLESFLTEHSYTKHQLRQQSLNKLPAANCVDLNNQSRFCSHVA